MKRIFLALMAQIDNYEKIQSDFSSAIKGRWTPKEKLHVTVKYFGNDYSVKYLLKRLPTVIKPVKSLKITSLGYFLRNNILYAKVESNELNSLNLSVSNLFDYKDLTPFVAHVTLMRIKKIENEQEFKELIKKYNDKEVGSTDTSLQLMQSELLPDGAEYSCIKRF